MTGSGAVSASARFKAALLAGSHQVASKAEVWGGDTLLATLTIEGSSTLTVSRSNAVRRTCSLVLTDPYVGTAQALVPATAKSLLTPFGNELVLYRGITYTDGTQEFIQVGVFGIEEVQVDDSAADLVITLTGNDRSTRISRAGFVDVYTIAPSTNVGTAVQALVNASWTGPTALPLSFAATDTQKTPPTPIVYKPGDDPWAMAQQLAASIGYELYFDAAGTCTFLPVPNPATAPIDWSYDEGATNIATRLIRDLKRTDAPNYIIRDGQGSGVGAVTSTGTTTFTASTATDPKASWDVDQWKGYNVLVGSNVASIASNTATVLTLSGGWSTGTPSGGKVFSILPPRGIAQDTNTSSPTYVGGPYGRVVNYQSSSLYTTQAQAQAAAQADLLLALGTIESIQVHAVPKPDHDVDDVIEVTRGRSQLAGATYVIDGFQMGFGTDGELQITARSIASMVAT